MLSYYEVILPAIGLLRDLTWHYNIWLSDPESIHFSWVRGANSKPHRHHNQHWRKQASDRGM